MNVKALPVGAAKVSGNRNDYPGISRKQLQRGDCEASVLRHLKDRRQKRLKLRSPSQYRGRAQHRLLAKGIAVPRLSPDML